jgi:hypothetical protein
MGDLRGKLLASKSVSQSIWRQWPQRKLTHKKSLHMQMDKNSSFSMGKKYIRHQIWRENGWDKDWEGGRHYANECYYR